MYHNIVKNNLLLLHIVLASHITFCEVIKMKSTSSRRVFVFFCFLFVITLTVALFGIYSGVRFGISPLSSADIFTVDYDAFAHRTASINVIVAVLLPMLFMSGTCSLLSPIAVYIFSFINCLAIALVFHSGTTSLLASAVSCIFFAACCLILIFASALSITLTVRKFLNRLINDFCKNRKGLLAKLLLCVVLCSVFAFLLYIYCYIIF